MNDERFHLLIEKYLEGGLSDEEARELAQALKDSPDLGRRMLDEVTMSGMLRRRQAESSVDLVPKVLAALRGAPDRSALVDKVLQGLPAKRRSGFPLGWLTGLAAAGIIAIVGWVYFGRPAPQPAGVPVAKRESGETIVAGQTLRVDSPTSVLYEDGTRLTLKEGVARFETPDRVALERGTVEADVSSHKIIGTPHGEARGFGSELEVHVESSGTRVSVAKGTIAFTRADDGAEVRLQAGSYAVAAAKDFDLLKARPAVDRAKVDAAVRKAVVYLRKSKTPSSGHYGPMSGHGLRALAMIHAGVDKDNLTFRKHVETMLSEPLRRTYVVAIQAMVLRQLDPVKYRERLAACAQFLLDNQCANGQWAYGTKMAAFEGDRIFKRRDGEPKMANNSCSQIAILGVRACADAGIEIPREVFARAAKWWAGCQKPDKDKEFGKDRAGWCYDRDEDPHHPYASMTAGGIAAAVIADAFQEKNWEENPAVHAAIRWLGFHYSAHENYGPVEAIFDKQFISDTPQPRTEFFYYLWALERAGTLTGTELFGAHDWYAEGVEAVLEAQRPDGSWHSGVSRCKPEWDTCYAILFLKRATRPLEVR